MSRSRSSGRAAGARRKAARSGQWARRVTFRAVLLSLLPIGALAGQPPAGAGAAAGLERTTTAAVERTAASVVTVTAYVRAGRHGQPEGRAPRSGPGLWKLLSDADPYPGFERLGSATGFVYRDDGTVLTARHALVRPGGELARVVDVETHDLRHFLCRVVAAEPTLNLAVLAVEVTPGGEPPAWHALPIGDSDGVRRGQWTLALGDPFGALRGTVAGIVAGLPSRRCYQGDLTSTFLQLAMTAHPESYGAAVVDLGGHVVGQLMPRFPEPGEVPSSGARGIEFALPMGIVKTVADSMLHSAEVLKRASTQSPWLGCSVLELAAAAARLRQRDPQALERFRATAPGHGVMIDGLYASGPAARAGLEVGDCLLSIDGHPLASVYDFQKWLYLSGVGREVELELAHHGERRNVAAKIEARPATAVPR